MRIFLISVVIMDGEHEHSSGCLKKAHNENEAETWARKECENEATGYWSYGDGLTRTKYRGLQEVTEEQANMVSDLGLAYYAKY